MGLHDSKIASTTWSGDATQCLPPFTEPVSDEGIIFELDGDVVGLATIAPEGEMHEGQPTIVALFVRHEYRGQGFGRKIMLAVIDRMRERSLRKPYRADATSSPGLRAREGLPEEYRADLDVRDMSMGGMLDIMMLA